MEKLKMQERCDVGFKFIFQNIFLNNRFKYYDYYIKLAKQKGYIVTSFVDYLLNYQNTDKKILILRHDVDHITKNTEEMFNIERQNNVKATYYFRWCTLDTELIKKMNNNAFEVGLHYETLATYCLKNNITKIDESVIEICRSKLVEEIDLFEQKTKVKVKTIANHGHPKNVELGVSNNVLLEGQEYKKYGIVSEAYDKEFYKNVVTHIMDNQILNNFGFAYKSNPINSICNEDKLIVFLAHPSHWKYNLKERLKMIIKILIGRYTTSTNREFKRIEKKGV